MSSFTSDLWPLAVIAAAAAVVAVAGVAAPASVSATLGDWLGFAGSVLGGLFTVGAAYIAWRSVKPQIDEARRQSAASAKMAMMHQPLDYESEMEILDSIYPTARKIRSVCRMLEFDVVAGFEQAVDLTDQTILELNSIREKLSRIKLTYPFDHPTSPTRKYLMFQTELISARLNDVDEYLRSLRFPDDVGKSFREGEINALVTALPSELSSMGAAIGRHRRVLREAMENLWAEIRFLESVALGRGNHSASPTS